MHFMAILDLYNIISLINLKSHCNILSEGTYVIIMLLHILGTFSIQAIQCHIGMQDVQTSMHVLYLL